MNNNELKTLWNQFNQSANELRVGLGRTSNLVGEYAEFLVCNFYKGTLLPVSEISADVKGPKGKLYQVKARKVLKGKTTQLSVIRSWDFDYLVVILFDASGEVIVGLEFPVAVAKEYAKPNSHQNGGVISTTRAFLGDKRGKDISSELVNL